MALVDDGTVTMAGSGERHPGTQEKKVFLVAAFKPAAEPSGEPGRTGPRTGIAEDVVAVIGTAGRHYRFEWVGPDQRESIDNPALVTPVKVRLAVPSPWHSDSAGMLAGLVQLDTSQLGDGPVDDDVDHLLAELAKSRGGGNTGATG